MKNYYINKLNLNLEIENGFLSEVQPNTGLIPSKYLSTDFPRKIYSFAYYLLPFGLYTPWHKLKCHQSWQFCDGKPLKLHLISENGEYSQTIISEKDNFVHIVEPGIWQAAEVIGSRGNDFTLLSHFNFPQFDKEDRCRGSFDRLINLFPHLEKIIDKFKWDDKVNHQF